MSIKVCTSTGEPLQRLFQWDVNQTIQIYGADLTGDPVVHFAGYCGRGASKATPAVVDDHLEVQIPNVTLEQPGPLRGYVCYPNGVNAVHTQFHFCIPIVRRGEPDIRIREEDTVTLSGNPARANVEGNDAKVKSAVIGFTAFQAGSGTASTSNIRPILGRSSMSITAAGAVLNGGMTVHNGAIGSDGSVSSTVGTQRHYTSAIPVSGVSQVMLHFYSHASAVSMSVHAYNANGEWMSKITDYTAAVPKTSHEFQCNVSSAAYIRVSGSDFSDLFVANKSPYEKWTANFTGGIIAYRGSFDISTGVLTLTHAFKEFDGTETWSRIAGTSGNPHYFYYPVGDYNSGVNGSEICSHWAHVNIASSNALTGVRTLSSTSGGSNFRLAIRPTDAASLNVTTFKAYVKQQYDNGTPIQALWQLKTPITYNMNGKTIRLPDGTQAIWADDGSLNLRYIRGLSSYFDDLRETGVSG